jgi:hypothetical protein
MNDDALATVDRHDDVDFGAEKDKEVVRDVTLAKQVLPVAHPASNAHLREKRNIDRSKVGLASPPAPASSAMMRALPTYAAAGNTGAFFLAAERPRLLPGA